MTLGGRVRRVLGGRERRALADDLLTGPLRGELLGSDHLAERARSVAKGQRTVATRNRRRAPLLARLDATRRLLAAAQARLATLGDDVDVGPAGAWLLDNYHVVEEHIREVRASLPLQYYRKLPELSTGPLAGSPRVYELAITLISHTEGRIDLANVDLFVGAAQEIGPLSLGELWAMPAMLRLGLLENVRRMALRTVRRLDELDAADAWSARIQAVAGDGSELADTLRQFVDDPPPLSATLVSRLLQQLRATRGSFAPLLRFEQWLAEESMTAESAAAQATQRLAATQVTMANSITSLRAIAHADWPAFVERQSRLDAVLREDPAGCYARMTFATRDRYRHVVEQIARATRRDEAAVARCAIDLARSAVGDDDARRAHVGYYLVDEGRGALELATSYRPTIGAWALRQVMGHPNAVLSGAIGAGTLALLALVSWLAHPLAWPAWLAVMALAFIPANDIAVGAANQLLTALLPPDVLPKLDLSGDGRVPAELRTAVVVPTLLDDVSAVQAALEHLEVQFLANRDPHVHFALLSDFTDASAEAIDGDAEIIAAAADGVRALNARYAPDSDDAFYLFHRPRRWNARQGVWMGWERKRGKLAEFNRFLRASDPHASPAFATVVGNTDAIRRARYVITLDADTMLPPGAAALLIGALAHPLNRAWYDAALGRVTRGYGILQPRVDVTLPSAHATRFAAIQSGRPGVDPYTAAVSDVYQDLYREGSFTGKGIYDVDAFEEATHGRFPENALLSHDLIEGSFARAGLASDIVVLDDYPARYLTFTRRKHRWIRGDWQLLRWLGPRVPGPDGPEPNRLSTLSRWRLFDNLRRSTVEIAQLTMLVAGWTLLPGSILQWTVAGLVAVAAPWIVSFVLAACRPPRGASWRAHYGALARDGLTSLQQVGLTLAFLPHQALVSADAIVRTLWRLAVSRRHMLEWQTASVAERTAAAGAGAVWRAMWIAPALAAAVLAGTVHLYGPTPPLVLFALPLLLLWAISPVIAHAISIRAERRERPLTGERAAEALRYARAHWRFFERFVNEGTHWLPPDNFQEAPYPVVAMRTSPTNIGLALLATVSAHDLGFIDLATMVERLEFAFGSLDRMPRFRGHLYNWYDLHDLSVLRPAYVSTVDSGNLAGHMLALRQACLALAVEDPAGPDAALRERLEHLAARAEQTTMGMDFRFLFDEERELFAIGYQTETRTRDASHYDLLASEARLASFVAIAKGDVPVEHWFRLGRTLTHAAGATALVSWSGSMFEYLMPLLVMRSYPSTLLDQTYRGAVDRQVAYGAAHGVPWGISESAYNMRDRHLTYQYRSFGVPDLALKRGLERDLVVAPYATALALLVEPERALENLARLEAGGALGEYGFRDALDYTRPAPRQSYAVVGTFMAHHTGMTLVALANLLTRHAWQRRFHADPLVQSAALLLHERIPRLLDIKASPPGVAEPHARAAVADQPVIREIDTTDTPQPRIALLGHLPYTIMVSHAGGGYSRYEDLAVTRWRADGTRDDTGQFCYVKDISRGRLWSAAHQPVCAPADRYRALLATDRVMFHRADGDIETRTEIAVVPEDAAEVRRVSLTNNGSTPRDVELTSYGEVVLGPPDADRAHPAFANLFVETEWHEWCSAITATRRPRSATEQQLWCVHVVDAGPGRVGAVSCETDRARFIGHGRSRRDPRALDVDGALSGTTGAVLDPVVAIRVRVRLAPGETTAVAFTTLVATSRTRAFALADRYHDGHTVQRALDLAWTFTQVELRELGISSADAAVFQELAGHLLYSNLALRAPQDELRRNEGSQLRLWANGLSGDLPILLATIDSIDGLPSLRQILGAHHFLRRHGMAVDLLVLNEQASGYQQALAEQIAAALFASSGSSPLDQPGGVFVRRADQLSAEDQLVLRATARVHLPCDGRPLALIVEAATAATSDGDDGASRGGARGAATPNTRDRGRPAPPARVAADSGPRRVVAEASHLPLAFDNGTGGLAADGAYQIRVRGDAGPPTPWTNVVANPVGGFVVSERGAGFTWADSSYFFRLTPWRNDPVSDPVGEALYLRDEASGHLWSATPAPVRTDAAFVVRHDAGLSTFEHEHESIATHLTMSLDGERAVKLSLVRITNRDSRPRRITLTAYAEWVLGVDREHAPHRVRTMFDARLGTLFGRNVFDPQYAGHVAFLSLSEPVTSHTGDRRSFLGRNGATESPRGLARDVAALDGVTGAGHDPCAALQCLLELAPGESREVVVALGAAEDEATARQAVADARDVGRARAAIDRTRNAWRARLGVVQVHTPAPSFDAMLNRWTLYQALGCRMWARSAFYQSSGAYGFRDQLQDVMAFVHAEPGVARAHILRAAARQFVEGDVQHWWHPRSGTGVRTRFSDDLAWLPYVVDHYVGVTGDAGVLDEMVPFLAAPPLGPEEHERYDAPAVSNERASVYEHCLRALRKACTVGVHGLPLMGDGDWNDGMNRVGTEGRGESVWLAWFLATVLRAFAPHAETRGDPEVAAGFRAAADAYVAAVEAHGWDGAWYRRAYFDDGTPLGSATSDECRIDAIAQSWSVISGAGAPERQRRAMASLREHLVREEARVVLLLAPPFDTTPHDPGYIKGYVPGVRENGAQYTHAALWAVLATALLGDGDGAFELFEMLDPLTHALTPAAVDVYGVEPYVVAADVYTASGHVGRGGWTWYTGSASWMYRVGLEAILGFTRRGDTLTMAPRVPAAWPELTVEYRHGTSLYVVRVLEPARVGREGGRVRLDGRLLDGTAIPLADDGARHDVVISPAAGEPAPE